MSIKSWLLLKDARACLSTSERNQQNKIISLLTIRATLINQDSPIQLFNIDYEIFIKWLQHTIFKLLALPRVKYKVKFSYNKKIYQKTHKY